MVASPKPRTNCFYGRLEGPALAENGTWLETESFAYPHGGMTRRALADCDDGKRCVVWVGIPDTYSTIPGYRRVKGKKEGKGS